jgi:methylphosphotriester-DNA--protein-cysteine methyltransferase
MTAENESLEAAAQALHQAQEALHAARRNLTEAILNAYANGEPVSQIARRTGHTSTDVWNTLAVHGITRSTHLNGSHSRMNRGLDEHPGQPF